MQTLFKLLLRLVLLLAGTLFALSLLVVAVLLLALWGLRALWARLTGQPVVPFVLRTGPRTGFRYAFRSRAGPVPPGDGGPEASGWDAAPRPLAGRGAAERRADIEDVEPKPPRD